MTIEDLVESWKTNNSFCLELLRLCPDDAFDLKPGKGKTIRSQYVHIIQVRTQWVAENLPDVASQVSKLDWKTANREDLHQGLLHSSVGVEALLRSLDQSGKSRSPAQFFGYIVAHDAHHRAQVELTLRLHDKELSDKEMYSLWNWNRKRPEL